MKAFENLHVDIVIQQVIDIKSLIYDNLLEKYGLYKGQRKWFTIAKNNIYMTRD